MSASVKSRIIARVLELCEPLRTAGDVRLIARKRTVFLVEPIKPALHLIVGDEIKIAEDSRGYTMEFPIGLKLIFADARDVYAKGDDLVALLQTALETDHQLNSLANAITYEGETPFTEEQLKPDGGVLLNYVIQYRRTRGGPDTNY